MRIQLTLTADVLDLTPAEISHAVMEILKGQNVLEASCTDVSGPRQGLVDNLNRARRGVVQEDGALLMKAYATDENVEYSGVCTRCNGRAAVSSKTGLCRRCS